MKLRKIFKRWYIFVLLFALLIGGYLAVDGVILSYVMSIGEAQLRNVALVSINSAMKETIAEPEDYNNLVIITNDEEGNITSVQADTVKINEIANKMALTAQRNLASVSSQSIKVPLGNVIGGQIFSGKGPRLQIWVEPIGSVSTAFYTEFESAGINQTRHKIYIVIHAYMRMMIGNKTKSTEISSEMLIAETIIVGVVPDSFVNVESTDDLLNLLP